MSNNFKPLSEQVANKLIAQLEEVKSVFQQGNKPLQMPFNPTTNIHYRGAAALVLLMSNREDPRWMSLENANYNKTPVNKGEKGTLISFYKTSEMKPVMKDGQPVLKENQKPQMEKVKLAEPELVNVFLWNGEQLKEMPVFEAKPQEFSPVERARQIMENSKLVNPPQDYNIPNEESYYSAILKDMAGLKVAEKASDSGIKDALKTNIASLFISAKLNLPFDLGDHIGYTASWSQLIKEQPAELFKAANDAQKIADHILGFEKKKEQELSKPATLNKGDIIAYKGDTITVKAILRGKTAQVENSEGKNFKISPKDGIYTGLIEAKNNPERGKVVDMPAPEKHEEQTHAMAR
ncbi:MAG TPA: ArdC-like ssDNA-binding domain-containing protein [Mucilaginibacter sp.]|jgi:antirestriction protein ArdC|nr:ArdC-like ssDNA-binding domain-containing protein [Mucilaginibacter sp.]